jgi:hypothetical protein
MNKMASGRWLVPVLAAIFVGAAWAKLPPPTEEQKARAEEAKVKAADAAKKDAESLSRAQDRVAQRYIEEQKAKGVIVTPTPLAVPVAAATTATPASAGAAAEQTPAKK